jgi:poly-gamma-glutamate capsule biosynthesis protein CapA/YwtB (metallophosphatase superfamily)
MTTLAVNKVRAFDVSGVDEFGDLPAVATDILYQGSAAGLASGYARPLVAADDFVGFVHEKCDNAAGAAAAKNVKIKSRGYVTLAVTGVTAVTDVGSTVYASDDDTFTLASTGNSSIGKIVRYISSTTVVVYFEAKSLRSI